jgi:DNA-binding MarR family transcriptional regulator
MGRHTPESNSLTLTVARSIADAPGTSAEIIDRLSVDGYTVWRAIKFLVKHERITPVDHTEKKYKRYKITRVGMEWIHRVPRRNSGGTGIITPLTYRQQLMREILEANKRANESAEAACGVRSHPDGRARARSSGASRQRLRKSGADTIRGTETSVSVVSDDCGVV